MMNIKEFGKWFQKLIDKIRKKDTKPVIVHEEEIVEPDKPIEPVKPEEPIVVEPSEPSEPVVPVDNDMQLDGFLWEPLVDSVRIVIPSDIDVTRFTLATLSPHVYIYGPGADNRHEYILQGNGQHWYDVAVNANPKKYCSIMVYVNRGSVSPVTKHPSDGWRVMDPRQRVIGDKTTRLQQGQNK
jgi:hypothetical protein